MSEELNHTLFDTFHDAFFTQHGQYFSTKQIKKNSAIPFKDHPQLHVVVDILSRKYNHHVVLNVDFSSKMHTPFLEALLHHLAHDNLLHRLSHVELLYLDVDYVIPSEAKRIAIKTDFERLRDQLDAEDTLLIFALTNTTLLSKKTQKAGDGFLYQQFKMFLKHPKCRFLILTNAKKYKQRSYLDDQFDFLHITRPTETDVLSMLKKQRTELEAFHHIIIPEELLTYAYALSERYLSTSNTLEKTLLLLDSSAARTSAIERNDSNQFKPVMTGNALTGVLSGWTQIPATHLHLNKFKLNEFIQGMRQRIFGQDAALEIIGRELQQAQAHLQQNSGPFCSLLFAGPEHSGKKTAARALADQIFKQSNVLYYTQPSSSSLNSIADIKLQQCHDRHSLPLKKVIRETPHAMIMFENIDQLSPTILDGLFEILSTGYLHDDKANQYNFRQAIVIMSTTVGSNRLFELTESFSEENEMHDMDLMQLVMNEQSQGKLSADQHYSPQELIEEISPDMLAHLPPSICKYSHLVPFLALNHEVIGNIIRLRLKLLGKMLDLRYGIEFGYAPEIIPYLVNEVLMKQKLDNQTINIEKTLKHLYFTIEQTIMNQADNKNRPNQLFLQLNESGQVLRCDWLVMTAMRHHAP